MFALTGSSGYAVSDPPLRERSKPVARRNAVLPWRMLFLVAVGGAMGLAFVWLQSGLQTVSSKLQAQQRQMVMHQEELENLRMQLETYTSGEYILRESRKLGLHPPMPGQVRRVNIHIPGVPAPASQTDDSLLAKRQ